LTTLGEDAAVPVSFLTGTCGPIAVPGPPPSLTPPIALPAEKVPAESLRTCA
jgi:hypothetical protein